MSQRHKPKRDRRRERAPDAPAGGIGPRGAEATVGSVTLPRPESPVKPARPAKPSARRERDGRGRPARPERVTPAPVVTEEPGEARPRRLRLTWEGVTYCALLVAAALTRFWDLGSRALHHDESLHAYYSWVFATGGNYEHDPLMHGPFLFHANALVYLLFGDSDATSRYMPALFGTVLVGLPWFLRGPRFLGRFGALAASALFLISPSFLYYSRYIRHDIYTVVGSLLLFICLARYVERPHRGWLIGAGASVSFLFANHEIVFAIVAVFAGYLWGALLWGRLRALLWLQIGTLALAGAAVLAMPAFGAEPLPEIPWDRSGREAPLPTREIQLNFYLDLAKNPTVIALVLLAAAFVVGSWWVLRDERRRGGPLLADAPPGSVEAAVVAAGRDRTGLWTALAVAGIIFVVLFTTFFTNIYGLASGTVATDGTLLYWLGQQGVRRGDQPWFFFLVETPQYEFLLVAFGLAGTVVTLWRAYLAWRDPEREDPALFFRLWIVVWFGALFLALSYAGEKMPWLIVHFTLPGLLLAGAFLGDLVERCWAMARREVREERREDVRESVSAGEATRPSTLGLRRRLALPRGHPLSPLTSRPNGAWLGPGLAVALLALAAGWFLLAADLTYGEFVRVTDVAFVRVVTEEAADRWWLLALPPLAALALIGFAWLARSAAFAGRWATIALVAGLALLQIHAAWRLSYLEGDVPIDMLIYNQTSPDVTRMMDEIGEFSAELTGGNGIVVMFDSYTAWPMWWYLRDYPNKVYIGDRLNEPPPQDVAFVIVANENLGNVQPYLAGYTPQEYVLRWHNPEDALYRHFAIAPELDPGLSAWDVQGEPHDPVAVLGSIGDSVATQFEPEGEQRLYRIVAYRDMPATFIVYDYTLFIRDDLLPLFNSIRY
jgi:predicted membrane-bound mannosyltransferase